MHVVDAHVTSLAAARSGSQDPRARYRLPLPRPRMVVSSAVVARSRLSVRSNRVTRVAGGSLLSQSTRAWGKSEQQVIRASERRTVRPALWQRRRNGSGIVSGDIRREVVRDEPRADCHVLPDHNEAVPKGERMHVDNIKRANHTWANLGSNSYIFLSEVPPRYHFISLCLLIY